MADGAGRSLNILFFDGTDNIGSRHLQLSQFIRFEPDAHAEIRSVFPDISDTLDTADIINDIDAAVILEKHTVVLAVRRIQDEIQHSIRRNLAGYNPVELHFLGQSWISLHHPVLGVHGHHIRIFTQVKFNVH